MEGKIVLHGPQRALYVGHVELPGFGFLSRERIKVGPAPGQPTWNGQRSTSRVLALPIVCGWPRAPWIPCRRAALWVGD